MRFNFERTYKINYYINLILGKLFLQIDFMPIDNQIGISIGFDTFSKILYLDIYPFKFSIGMK